jgi:hypothetical protein
MDLASDRAAIAAAATAAGVSCSDTYRQLTRPGDAAVRFDGLTRDASGFGFLATWSVFIALSQTIATAEAWVDANAETLAAQLGAALVVSTFTPVDLTIDTGTIPALHITGTRPA